MLANVFGSHTMHIEPIYIEQLLTHLHLNIYVSSIQLHSIDNFQDDTLCGTDASVDVSTRENLEKLVKIGESLLKKPVSRVNLESGVTEPIDNGDTNEHALKK